MQLVSKRTKSRKGGSSLPFCPAPRGAKLNVGFRLPRLSSHTYQVRRSSASLRQVHEGERPRVFMGNSFLMATIGVETRSFSSITSIVPLSLCGESMVPAALDFFPHTPPGQWKHLYLNVLITIPQIDLIDLAWATCQSLLQLLHPREWDLVVGYAWILDPSLNMDEQGLFPEEKRYENLLKNL